MTEQNINAYCAICGEGYHLCKSCSDITSFKPWRTVTDNIDHYKIYLAIHGYTISKDKTKAKKELTHCNLEKLESFKPEIKNVIKEIMDSEDKVPMIKNSSKINKNIE